MSLIYQDPSMSHNDAISLLASGSEPNVVAALVSIGLNEQDRVWAQTMCLKYLDSGTELIAASAITSLGHIARRHGELDMNAVLPAFDTAKKKFPALEATIADTLDDIEVFT
ncbi:hypothetical protein [Pseudomonas sp. 10S4]|uniref:hypothetical protein n=1 Tax=Pseudomonas sp. 10S4 TaxID=3048583 RepID=UPI002AC93DCB|nr:MULTISPECIES: hypothetical protein [unclassified Pseudomonas]MEB0226961.1 hypothetical protein [Pseudomonas sp. 5S1]MEB0299096.1 hypothetical protein [Pseudomonas sp. 10S4]WPX17726.1 hypothetical protein RHM58_28475 [Pseudomonas sp. 10S4]